MRVVLLIVAAVVAIFAGVAALQLASPPPAETPQTAEGGTAPDVATVDVLVAKAGIPAGTQLTPAMIDRQPWPENLVLEGFIVGSSAEAAGVAGKITRAPLQPREPLLTSKLAGKEEAGFLAATLPPGMRAITIGTDAITGVAGFVYPGDRVDIVFTHSIPDKNSGNRPPAAGLAALGVGSSSDSVAEVLAANIPVLAVNIRDTKAGSSFSPAATLLGSASDALGAATGEGAGGSGNSPSSLTIQVTDLQAERIRLAERVGNLSLALRSVQDRGDDKLPPPTGISSLTQVQNAPTIQNVAPDEVRVIRGGMNAAPAQNSPIMPNLFNLMGGGQ